VGETGQRVLGTEPAGPAMAMNLGMHRGTLSTSCADHPLRLTSGVPRRAP
jgi:hypothetical protein